jgi:hypothetical protein
MPMWIGTIIHEAMHIKHTPKWLGEIARDHVDKFIINGFEDERIEHLACKQLKALPKILAKMVNYFMRGMVEDGENPGMKVIGNLAVENSGIRPFSGLNVCKMERTAAPLIKAIMKRHSDIITKISPSAFKSHLQAYYQELDQLKKVLQFDINPPPEPPPSEEAGDGKGEKGELRCNEASQDGNTATETRGLLEQLCGISPGKGCGQGIDMENMAITEHSMPLETPVRDRIKLALKKTLNVTADDGNILDTDELVSFITGDIDELFFDIKTEKKMRTKVYFLLDVSGSMSTNDMYNFDMDSKKQGLCRLDVSHGAFRSLQEIVNELKNEDGCDIDSEAFVFADRCEKWNMDITKLPRVGGGTCFEHAMQYTVDKILTEDPANKRILIVITDGDVYAGEIEATQKLLVSTGQDIRVVMLQVGNEGTNQGCFKHHINGPETANIAIFEAFEEAI